MATPTHSDGCRVSGEPQPGPDGGAPFGRVQGNGSVPVALNKLFESLTDAILIVDDAGTVLAVNGAAVALFGYERNELVGLDIEALVPEEARAGHAALRTNHRVEARSRAMNGELDLVAQRKDGSSVPVEIMLSRVRTENGHVVTAVVTDIRERRIREAADRHRQRLGAVADFAGGFAHEFNNILTSVIGFAELAAADPSSRQQAELLKNVQARARQAADLISHLLAFTSQRESEPQVVDLDQAVRRHLGAVRHLTPESVTITLLSGTGVPYVEIDPAHVGQVLTHLAANAGDAMPHGGTLTLATSLTETEVVLRITDTGTGMDHHTIEHAFDPFFSTKGLNGIGLGLSSAHGIVEAAGGHIELVSTPGAGTTVLVGLPLVSAPPPDRVPESSDVTAAARRRILVVEDEPNVRALTCLMLESIGHDPVAASTPAEALARSDIAAFDAVVSDMVMPGLSGPELVCELRRRSPGLRVLYVSGYTSESVTLGDRDRFLSKPFGVTDLTAGLDELLCPDRAVNGRPDPLAG